jgi:class 3 adenylate cyclase/tetratricopeptide (TPR) repeat protein
MQIQQRCTSCGVENPERAKFCLECGSPLAARCPQCGIENPPKAKFCLECGTPLVPRAAPSPAPEPLAAVAPARSAVQAERRQLTVMFCDLAGSTALAEKLDPEDLHHVLAAYQQASANAIRPYEGYVAKYLGDGLVVFFGYPQAHEDDAERAVRAARDILEAIGRLNAEHLASQGVKLAVRIGIHTGLVIAGEMGDENRKSLDIVGETPNIAARLQEVAAPHSVVVSAATHKLIATRFEFHALGPHRLKGLSRPVDVFQVLRPSDGRMSHIAFNPLVGREQELSLLHACWIRAAAGIPSVAIVTGDAGIGKSRLVEALCNTVREDPELVILEVRCSPYHISSPFHPIITLLQELVGFEHEDTPALKLIRIEAFLETRAFSTAEVVPVLAALLSVSLEGRYPPSRLSPEAMRHRTLDLLLKLLMWRATRQSLLFVVENVHWADPSTVQLLELLISSEASVRIFTLLTCRPLYTLPFELPPGGEVVPLGRLADTEVRQIIARITGDRSVPEAVVLQLLEKTDGVPLYAEEMAKMILETGQLDRDNPSHAGLGALPEVSVPATLADSLMARLDRLTTFKEVAQIASVLGREFTFDLLHAVSPLDARTLRAELDRLVSAELLFEGNGPTGDQFYRFKHALIQDAAYMSLLNSSRQQYHRQIAWALVNRFSEIAEREPELVAGHYTSGGEIDPALAYWNLAGMRARERSANQEAIMHGRRAIELIESSPRTRERDRQELFAQASLGMALVATRGFAAPEVWTVLNRAEALCAEFEGAPEVFPVLLALSSAHMVRKDLKPGLEKAKNLLRLGEQTGDALVCMVANYQFAHASFWVGDFHESLARIEDGLNLYEVEKHPHYMATYSQDPAVILLGYQHSAKWHLGEIEQYERSITASIAHARQIGHPFSMAWALGMASANYAANGEVEKAAAAAEEALAIALEQNFFYWVAISKIYAGWARVWRGDHEEGLKDLAFGTAAFRATGAELISPYNAAMYAEALWKAGKTADALDRIASAFEEMEEGDRRMIAARLHQIRGKCLLDVGRRVEAEEALRLSIALAERMNCLMWLLQSTVCLARMLIEDGRREDARGMLAHAMDLVPHAGGSVFYREAIALRDTLEAV